MTGFATSVKKLVESQTLTASDYKILLDGNADRSDVDMLHAAARHVAQRHFGRNIRIRGLIEITNRCRNNCYYCGLRRDNATLKRYTLSISEILDCCRQGYEAGLRTFVLQGGENHDNDSGRVEHMVAEIHRQFPEAAITLSLGEWQFDDYLRFFKAGASRYLLRHETYDSRHYSRLHPAGMSRNNRLECLNYLKQIGYQTGTGIMVGSPWQTVDNIIDDIMFISRLHPEMIGIGPFLPHSSTPFRNMPAGSLELTLRLISIFRLINPGANIPATTALATISGDGRKRGILAGANVVMPNLSPSAIRKDYSLYDNKVCTGLEAVEGLAELDKELNTIGYSITTERGDYKNV